MDECCGRVGAGTTRSLNSLRLLPSGPDRVGESAVRPTPAPHMGHLAFARKLPEPSVGLTAPACCDEHPAYER